MQDETILNGIDPYEDELEDGVPGWLHGLMLLILTACVFVFRAFCRFLCPLGALYGLMAKLALLGVKPDEGRCTDCGACLRACPMDIRRVGDSECVHCGSCIDVCPTKAISFRAGKIVLHGPEVPERGRQK